MLRFTDPNYDKQYSKLSTFLCMCTEERSFIIGKCAGVTDISRTEPGQYISVQLMNPGAAQLSPTRQSGRVNPYTHYEKIDLQVIEIIDPDARTTIKGLRCDGLQQAMVMPRFLLNKELIDEVVHAWGDMVRQETDHLHTQISTLERKVTRLEAELTAPKNQLGKSVNPQRRINLD